MTKHLFRILPQSALFAGVAAIVLAFATSTKGDPLLFSNVAALQNNGSTRVDLFSNPGATLQGPQISFLVDVTGTLPPGTTNILQITYSEAGSAPIVQSFQIPVFGTIQPPFTLLFTITSPGATYTGVSGTLTIDILGSSPDFIIPGGPNAGNMVDSFSYSFNVARPVPEPATVSLMLVGISGLVANAKRRKR